ncbi:MAG: hypothetical protein U1F49_14870 [Rubrivivax sp.]
MSVTDGRHDGTNGHNGGNGRGTGNGHAGADAHAGANGHGDGHRNGNGHVGTAPVKPRAPPDLLALRSAIERQNGRFEVLEAEAGHGMRFVIELPLRAIAAPSPRARRPRPLRQRPRHSPRAASPKARPARRPSSKGSP